MVVYADVLLVLNLIVDYFLISLTAHLLRKQTSFWRRLAGSAVGAVSSLYIFLPPIPMVGELFLRILLGLCITIVALGFGNWKNFLRSGCVFLLVTFGYGGAMIALWYLWKPHGMVIHNSVVYFDISPLFLIVFSIIGYVIVILLRKILDRNGNIKDYCDVRVCADKKTVQFVAIADTGNSVEDVFGISPVIIADKAAVESLFDFSKDSFQNRYRAVPCNTVTGNLLLDGYRCDKAYVKCSGKITVLQKPILAISKETLGGDYSAIINPKILES